MSESIREALAGAERDADEHFTTKPVGAAVQACPGRPHAALVACIESVTFRSDHLIGAEKMLRKEAKAKLKINNRPVVSEWGGDGATLFKKPEWDTKRGGSADSHPISQTKATKVKVDVVIHFTKVPRGIAVLAKVTGTSKVTALNFERQLVPGPFEQGTVITVSDGETVTIKDLVATHALPDHVALIAAAKIDWSVEVSNNVESVGQTGPHTVYVTFDRPSGKAEFGLDQNNTQIFNEAGDDQVVTEKRLAYSVMAAEGKGRADEQECVDAIFARLKTLGVGYTLEVRWTPSPHRNETNCDPRPDLHHYLWLCNAKLAEGECHNIAAGYRLACRILGTKEPMTVAFMRPWPSRVEGPSFPKTGDKIQGRLNNQFRRVFSQGRPVNHVLGFLDGSNQLNAFEGVVKYRRGLYAIGDAIFDSHQSDTSEGNSDDLNSSTYFAKRAVDDKIRPGPASMNPEKGLMRLQFVDLSKSPPAPATFQYPFVNDVGEPQPDGSIVFKPGTFMWED